MDIGFIGLGNIGEGTAATLQRAGHRLIVHDLNRDRAAALLTDGAAWAASPREAAARGEVIFSSLPGPAEVDAVALGADGVLAGIRPGSVYVEMSTGSPTLVRRIAAQFKEQGADMLDAPVSGGTVGARTGQLTLMVGGEEAVFRRLKPVLDAIGSNVVHCGGIGSGTVCKLVHNTIGHITIQAITECFTLGVKAGADPKALWETSRRGMVGSGSGIHMLPETWFSGNFEPDWKKGFFSTGLMRKDIGLTMQMAREFQVPMALAEVTEQELVEAVKRGWGNDPYHKARLLQEERAGVQVRGDFPAGKVRLVFED